MGKKDIKANCEVNLITWILRLLGKNTPVLALWQHKGELKKIGSKNMSSWFDNLDDGARQTLTSHTDCRRHARIK